MSLLARLFVGVVLVLASFRSMAAEEEPLIPATFNQLMDGLGFRWDLTAQGTIGDGTNDCFDNGSVLRVNKTNLTFGRAMMTQDGSEYVFTARSGAVAITRRVRLDVANAMMRYVEVFNNTGTTDVVMQVNLHTDLGGPASTVMTDRDKAFTGTFAKDEGAFVAMQNGDRPGLVFLAADAKSKVKPTVLINSNRGYDLNYDLTIKPGATVAILHYLAQRNAATPSIARLLVKQYTKEGRFTDPKLPKSLTKFIVNFPMRAEEIDGAQGPTLSALQAALELAEIDRAKGDTVALDAGAKLAGTVTGQDFTMETEFGAAKVAFADIAGIAGGGGVQRPVRIYLRTGEILSGKPLEAKLSMTTDTGLTFDINLAQIQILAMRRGPTDGVPPPEAGSFLTTHRGDCLALTPPGAELQAASPWGMLRIPFKEIDSLSYIREPFPAHRLILYDRSRVLVMIRGGEWELSTVRFGKIKLPPQSVAELVRAGSAAPAPSWDAEEKALPALPMCELVGQNRLMGMIDLPVIHLVSTKSTTELDPKTIARIERTPGEENSEAQVKLKLADGQELTGRLTETILPVRTGERVWRVPLAHFLTVTVPTPKAADPEDPAAPAPQP